MGGGRERCGEMCWGVRKGVLGGGVVENGVYMELVCWGIERHGESVKECGKLCGRRYGEVWGEI